MNPKDPDYDEWLQCMNGISSLDDYAYVVLKFIADTANFVVSSCNLASRHSTGSSISEQEHLIAERTFALFAHLFNRGWMAHGCSTCHLASIQESIWPKLARLAVINHYGERPDEILEHEMDKVLHRFNSAEILYSKCTELVSKENPFSPTSLFGLFSHQVAKVLGCESDPYELFAIHHAAAQLFTDLDELAKHAKHVT
ncbi:hypothetical protein [Geothrix sp. PMB-07]|uniref:hypothetical protein n=1 Tax=Geothrix sp. PMB-07 TaxID=3068640 RepID=UPI002741488C|nr:hypothetical protein [Geothrix sp. PMB-07]WLT30641.1 hypothetical protein Q9293_13045 [Geothrix sp. PMB-07]